VSYSPTLARLNPLLSPLARVRKALAASPDGGESLPTAELEMPRAGPLSDADELLPEARVQRRARHCSLLGPLLALLLAVLAAASGATWPAGLSPQPPAPRPASLLRLAAPAPMCHWRWSRLSCGAAAACGWRVAWPPGSKWCYVKGGRSGRAQ